MNHVTMKIENVFDTPLVFNDTLETSNIRNILLIDSLVSESQLFFDSANSNTFPIIYSYNSNRNDFSQLLDKKFSNLKLERISFVFHDNILNGKTFLNQELLFLETDISDDASTFSPNTQLLLDTIQKMDVKHIDFLACNSLNYSNWKGFYAMLTKQTNVIVGASNDKTGNLNYGGDWIMENTNENIVNTYFNSNIEEYVSTLAITISQNGGTIYIDQSGNIIRYQSNSTSGSWTTISSWPVTFVNSNPISGNILTISLFTNITISTTTVGTGTNGYFITGSNYITYDGSTSNYTVTIDGVTVGYLGFINNGASTINGYSNITVKNLKSAILNSSRLIITAPYGGWLCQSYFGKGSSNITINNCSNSGPTTGSANSGCICGAYFGYNGTATITQCFNTGSVTAGSTGGIFGSNLADTSGNVTISNCYNTGGVGANSGGICGLSAGSSNGTVNISNCYNSGNISGNGGGGGIAGYLFGTNTNQTCSISNCYNTGNISTTSVTTSGPGGICARGSGYNSATITYNPIIQITNCYNVGTIDASSNGILGGNGSAVPNNKPTINITNCYTLYTGSGTAITSMTAIYATITQTTCGNSSSWVDTTVNLYLTGTPTSLYVNNPGATWVTLASNTPYRLSSLNSISGISQTAGTTLGNTLVTIFGNSLAGTTSVTFGANPATNITVVNDTTITCKTPANSVGNVDVVVTRTNIGASNPIYFTYVEYPTIYMTGGSFKGTLLTFN